MLVENNNVENKPKVKMYYTTSSLATKVFKQYLLDCGMDVEVIRVCDNNLTKKDFYEILSLSESGVFEILAERSFAYSMKKAEGIDFNDLTLSQLYEMIVETPKLLKTPIVLNSADNRLSIGIDIEQIQRIPPKSMRKYLDSDVLKLNKA